MTPSTDLHPRLQTLLAGHRIWGQLDMGALQSLAAQWRVEPMRQGERLLAQGRLHSRLGLVVEGGVVLSDPDLDILVHLHPADMFGFGATPSQHLNTLQATVAAGGIVAWLEPAAVAALCRDHAALAYHFPSLPAPASLVTTERDSQGVLTLLNSPVRMLIKRDPIALPPHTSIRAGAQQMRELRVSSVLLVEQGHLFGLVTDRDLRNRVVAQGLDIDRPMSDIATLAPMTLQAQSPAFDALLLMARHNVHHVPVMEGDRVIGMITATDLTEQHSASAVYLAGDVYKQTALDGLVRASAKVKLLQQHLAAADASAYSTGHIVTTITDALTVRLLQLAEAQLGPPPVDYVWVAAG